MLDWLGFIVRGALKRTALVVRMQGWKQHRRDSYSQFGEDVYILGFYDRLRHKRGIDVKTGVIVDVGAFRPIKLSNTYAFYKRGWRVISIDPAPGYQTCCFAQGLDVFPMNGMQTAGHNSL